MTDRPDIPEEAVEEARPWHSGSENELYLLLQAAAPALRKQGAEEERERLREAALSLDAIDNAQIAAGLPNQRGGIDRPTAEQMRKGIEAAFHVAALDTPAPSEPGRQAGLVAAVAQWQKDRVEDSATANAVLDAEFERLTAAPSEPEEGA